MRSVGTDGVPYSGMCLCVNLPGTTVGPAKTDEQSEMPFGMQSRVGSRNHALDLGPDPHVIGHFGGGDVGIPMHALEQRSELPIGRPQKQSGVALNFPYRNSAPHPLRYVLSSKNVDHLLLL